MEDREARGAEVPEDLREVGLERRIGAREAPTRGMLEALLAVDEQQRWGRVGGHCGWIDA